MSPALKSRFFNREHVALAHAGLVVVAASWMLGGIGPTLEWIVALLAAPSLGLLAAEAHDRLRSRDRAGFRRLLRWLAPLALLAALVVVSALNPSHRIAIISDIQILRPVPHVEWLPASARPAQSLRVLACLGGLAATGLSLAFCTRSRRALRVLLLVVVLNTLALAVLGTVQRQTGATGPLLNQFPAPNTFWFSTFLYHNHWGAFAILSTGLALGLVFQSLRQTPERGWLHGPGPLVALAALLVAATVPLSGSRSSSVIVALLLSGAASISIPRLRADGRLGAAPVAVLAAAAVLLAGLIVFQSRDTIASRTQTTLDQLATIRTGAGGYARAELYADTWRMAADRPAFGWGLESYGSIFLNYSRVPADINGVVNTFEDAHSDWLQALAELGFVGVALLVLFAALPLVETLRRARPRIAEIWPLAACCLVAAYAWVEFPFANPAVVALWWVSWFAALRGLQLAPASSSPCSPSSS
jgi:O-antigen ligase